MLDSRRGGSCCDPAALASALRIIDWDPATGCGCGTSINVIKPRLTRIAVRFRIFFGSILDELQDVIRFLVTPHPGHLPPEPPVHKTPPFWRVAKDQASAKPFVPDGSTLHKHNAVTVLHSKELFCILAVHEVAESVEAGVGVITASFNQVLPARTKPRGSPLGSIMFSLLPRNAHSFCWVVKGVSDLLPLLDRRQGKETSTELRHRANKRSW